MSNLRVISDNAIDRASVYQSPTATDFPVTNLQLARKSDVWRAAGTTARLSATWATPETIQAVALPFCNLSPTATMRVRVTNEAQMTNLVLNSEDFSQASWVAYWLKPPLTYGVASPDGGNRATRFGPADASNAPGGTDSGVYAVAQSAVSGSVTVSIWARATSGTLSVQLGVNDSEQAWIQLSTTWTRYTYTSSAPLSLNAGDRIFQIHEATGSNQAWDVFGPQSEVGTSASSYYPSGSTVGTRPLGYIDSWQSYIDSGTQLACPAPAVSLRGFTAAQAASAYAFGGGATARAWLPSPVQAYGLAVDIVDLNNLPGYIEAAYLVAGPYWEAAINVDYGTSATLADSSKNERNDAGDLITEAGTMSKRLALPMSNLTPADRTTLWGILRGSGVRYPIFASLFPENADLALERDHQVYGKLVQLPAMSLPRFNVASATVEIESV